MIMLSACSIFKFNYMSKTNVCFDGSATYWKITESADFVVFIITIHRRPAEVQSPRFPCVLGAQNNRTRVPISRVLVVKFNYAFLGPASGAKRNFRLAQTHCSFDTGFQRKMVTQISPAKQADMSVSLPHMMSKGPFLTLP